MSFQFFNPLKVQALTAAGFTGKPFAASHGCQDTPCCGNGCCCHCPAPTPAGVAFNPPAGVGTKDHDRAVRAALAQAGV
jgi:hypothetical protein